MFIVYEGVKSRVNCGTIDCGAPGEKTKLQKYVQTNINLSKWPRDFMCFIKQTPEKSGIFELKVGQVGSKWDKSGAFSDQISVHFGSVSKNVRKKKS